MQSSLHYITERDLFIVPVCHYRMEFTEHVNAAFFEIKPDHIAVELPQTLMEHIRKGVLRFPCLSVICYQNHREDLIYFPIEPSDPFCEAIRLGLEHNVPVHFIDLDMDEYPHIFDPMPDSYSVSRIGLPRYWGEYKRALMLGKKPGACYEDELREINMSYHLQRIMDQDKKILLVCGMAHISGILEKLSTRQTQPVGKTVRKNIRIFNLHPDSIREVTGEMPFLISCYEMERGNHSIREEEEAEGKVISFAERRSLKPVPVRESEDEKGAFPQKRYTISHAEHQEGKRSMLKELMKTIAKRLNIMPEQMFPQLEEMGDVPDLEEHTYGRKLEIKRENIFKFKTSEDRTRELERFYHELRETKKVTAHSGGRPFWDRQILIIRMLKKAAGYYKENTGEELKTWQLKTLLKFSRNYAIVTGMLIADLYQLIMSARGVSDDNFAYEVWDLGSYYPWLDRSGQYETIHIHADEVWLGGRKFTLRRRFPRLRERLTKVPVRERRKERAPGEWTKEFNEMFLCSYPPEDIVIEGYGAYLKKKAISVLSEEKSRVEPFSNSLLDGIDVRETIRNWHHEKRIYVRENTRIGGGTGSVVVIFDEDCDDSRFPWKMTWLGEHDQESDMAFYSTTLGSKIVGPGISRCEYGGFMLTYPPMRLYDVWTDPFYSEARRKSEVLLMAAIEYSVEKHVVYVSASPPRSYFRNFAARLGKKIVYIPIGQLSPTSLKKLRVFHALSGRHLREIAKDFVW